MIIGLLGDIHGRIDLALTALSTWQSHAGTKFDLLLQVGDMGAFPSEARMDSATADYNALDPSEGDFGRMLAASGLRAASYQQIASTFWSPIYFIRGNHEDYDWLSQLRLDPSTGVAPADPFGLLNYVPDGSVLDLQGLAVAFLGGIQTDDSSPARIDQRALAALGQREQGTVDLLITHDCPLGLSTGYKGQVQGSQLISTLRDDLQPRFHIGGHYHISLARTYDQSRFLCLSNIVASARWHPEAKGIQAGWLAVLDTTSDLLTPIGDAYITAIESPTIV